MKNGETSDYDEVNVVIIKGSKQDKNVQWGKWTLGIDFITVYEE